MLLQTVLALEKYIRNPEKNPGAYNVLRLGTAHVAFHGSLLDSGVWEKGHLSEAFQ